MSLKDHSAIELKEALQDKGVNVFLGFESQELIDELEDRGVYDLHSLDTDTLRCALNDRNEEYIYDDPDIVNVYYALRDGDLDKVIELINPMLWETIGRKV